MSDLKPGFYFKSIQFTGSTFSELKEQFQG